MFRLSREEWDRIRPSDVGTVSMSNRLVFKREWVDLFLEKLKAYNKTCNLTVFRNSMAVNFPKEQKSRRGRPGVYARGNLQCTMKGCSMMYTMHIKNPPKLSVSFVNFLLLF